MRTLNTKLFVVAGIVVAAYAIGCAPQAPDVVVTPGENKTTVIHDRPVAPNNTTVVVPPPSHTDTTTTTTPDGSSSTTTTKSTGG